MEALRGVGLALVLLGCVGCGGSSSTNGSGPVATLPGNENVPVTNSNTSHGNENVPATNSNTDHGNENVPATNSNGVAVVPPDTRRPPILNILCPRTPYTVGEVYDPLDPAVDPVITATVDGVSVPAFAIRTGVHDLDEGGVTMPGHCFRICIDSYAKEQGSQISVTATTRDGRTVNSGLVPIQSTGPYQLQIAANGLALEPGATGQVTIDLAVRARVSFASFEIEWDPSMLVATGAGLTPQLVDTIDFDLATPGRAKVSIKPSYNAAHIVVTFDVRATGKVGDRCRLKVANSRATLSDNTPALRVKALDAPFTIADR